MKSILFAILICISSTLPEFAQTAPPQAAGYNLVFSDAFANFDLSPNGYGAHTWFPGIYYQAQKPSAEAIATSNSMLDLQWDLSSGQTNTSVEGCANDASYCNTFRYGYFEARMKWDVATGAWPAFWMITKQGVMGVQHVGELDIFEGQGSDPTHYYGTINEWNGGGDLVTSNSPANNRYQLSATNDFSQWHTYGLLWVPGSVTWYYDNVAVGTAKTAAIFDQQDFFMILGSQEGNNWIGGNLNGVSAPAINLNVQWVHVFQNAAYSPKPQIFTAQPLRILNNTLPVPNGALPYAVQVQVSGGTPPYTYAISSGQLPGGLQMAAGSGAITSVAGASLVAGTYSYTVQVTDAGKATVSQTYSGKISTSPLVQNFSSYALPNSSGANGITAGSDGALWFTTLDQTGGNTIGRITTAGTVTTTASYNALTKTNYGAYELATGGDIAADTKGDIWVAQRDGNAIGEIAGDNLSSQSTHVPVTANSAPAQIAAAPDGSLWFTEAAASQIGHVNGSGNLGELSTPTPASQPNGIAIGPNNTIEFTEPAVNKIGSMTEDGSLKKDFAIPTANSLPSSIVLGPDNAYWFTEFGANKIGRIDGNGNIAEAPVSSAPQAITVGPDGALYFTEPAANKIGRMTIFGALNEFSISDANSGATGIVAGPDGAVWFTENNLSKVGRLGFILAPTVSCTFPTGTLQTGTPFSGKCTGAQGTPPYAFGVTGNPPPGVTLNSSTGALSGTLTKAGTFTFTAAVSDRSSPQHTGQQSYTVVITTPSKSSAKK